jgi:hypothetical protein
VIAEEEVVVAVEDDAEEARAVEQIQRFLDELARGSVRRDDEQQSVNQRREQTASDTGRMGGVSRATKSYCSRASLSTVLNRGELKTRGPPADVRL